MVSCNQRPLISVKARKSEMSSVGLQKKGAFSRRWVGGWREWHLSYVQYTRLPVQKDHHPTVIRDILSDHSVPEVGILSKRRVQLVFGWVDGSTRARMFGLASCWLLKLKISNFLWIVESFLSIRSQKVIPLVLF